MKKSSILSCFAILVATYQIQAQNLLLNPSFEQSKPCGQNELVDSVANWEIIAGKPKFINIKCAVSPESRTYIRGMQLPDAAEGKVYAGLGMDVESEFIQGQLEKSLEKGKIYWVRAQVRLPIRFCAGAINEVGFAFGDQNLPKTEDFQTLNLENLAVKKENDKPINNQYNWAEISGFYTAKGGERFLCIGNFAKNNEIAFKNRKKGECTYLYIDAIKVEELKDNSLEILTPQSQIVENKRFMLPVEFNVKNELSEKSAKELNKLLPLFQNKEFKIGIYAHSDQNSTIEKQTSPTQSQANQIADYLVSKGVEKSRIVAVGKENSQNLVPNDTEANRLKNRRIEIIFEK